MALVFALWENGVKDLLDMLRMTDWELVPVNIYLRPMHAQLVCRHQSRCDFNVSVWTGDPPSKLLCVCILLSCALLSL